MDPEILHLLLADDDKDDCLLFSEALNEIPIATKLTTVYDGEQLMQHLLNTGLLPSVLFLDLNMPRKNGFECLDEIRKNPRFGQIHIVIISTSFDSDVSRSLFEKGANHFICKPTEFENLKKAVVKALTNTNNMSKQPDPSNFVLFYED